jgi:hypothetical protein
VKKQPRSATRVLLATVAIAVTIVVVAALVAAATGTLVWLPRGIIAIYFPPFLVNGGPDMMLVGFAVFLVLAAFLLYRRKYWSALAALALPIMLSWLLSWILLGD